MMREKSRARRRVRTRVALVLSRASLAGLYLIRLLGAALHVAGLSAVALSTAGTLLCFLLPALAGLFLLDGDQRGLIALRALSAQHVLCLAAAGALFVGPAALLAELPGAALRLCGAETAQAAAVTPDSALFLPMLLQSALLAPICEELFFRGYLMGAFAQAGRGTAIAAAAEELGSRAVRGRIASGDQFVASTARKEEIVRLFSAVTCEMEAGAIAHVCFLNRIPCAVIRCISDGGNEEAPMSYEGFLPMAAKNSAALTLEFLKIRGNL